MDWEGKGKGRLKLKYYLFKRSGLRRLKCHRIPSLKKQTVKLGLIMNLAIFYIKSYMAFIQIQV